MSPKHCVSESQLDLLSSLHVGKLPFSGEEQATTEAVWLAGISLPLSIVVFCDVHLGKDN